MKKDNIKILQESKGQTNIKELIKKGFKDNNIIAADIRQANSLLGTIIYHENTFYEGLTLRIINNVRVSVEPNNLRQVEADLFNHVRDLEKSIEDIGNNIWAYRFEFNDEETAKNLEVERNELQEILDDLKREKEKIDQKNNEEIFNT